MIFIGQIFEVKKILPFFDELYVFDKEKVT